MRTPGRGRPWKASSPQSTTWRLTRWAPARRYAVTGASYGARVACSCRYIGGRSLADCHKDMEGPVAWVSLSEDVATRSVTASYPLIASQRATFREGWGCQLAPWTGGH